MYGSGVGARSIPLSVCTIGLGGGWCSPFFVEVIGWSQPDESTEPCPLSYALIFLPFLQLGILVKTIIFGEPSYLHIACAKSSICTGEHSPAKRCSIFM